MPSLVGKAATSSVAITQGRQSRLSICNSMPQPMLFNARICISKIKCCGGLDPACIIQKVFRLSVQCQEKMNRDNVLDGEQLYPENNIHLTCDTESRHMTVQVEKIHWYVVRFGLLTMSIKLC